MKYRIKLFINLSLFTVILTVNKMIHFIIIVTFLQACIAFMAITSTVESNVLSSIFKYIGASEHFDNIKKDIGPISLDILSHAKNELNAEYEFAWFHIREVLKLFMRFQNSSLD